jgi:hypothetical protein
MTKTRFLTQALMVAVVGAASISPAGATSNPPDGSVAINYNRCDANYSNWGVHLFQRGSGGPAIPGVSWDNPMPPAGKTDFGVYWHAKLGEFPQGKVNYIIHKGDNKDQGGKDMAFDGNTTKEIWVNSGDRNIYTSLDEAKKGREAAPCK